MTASVVIPVHNGERWVAEAVHSALAQSLAPGEIIVVDDGSSDRSAELAAAAGARVVVRAQGGPGAARNHGVELAAGELVAFLDADDLMHPDRLRGQVEVLEADPGAIGALGLIGAAAPGRPVTWTVGEPGVLPSTLTVRRDAFLATGGFATDLASGEFIDWMDRCRTAGLRLAMLDRVVAVRRAHADNLTRDRAAVAQGYLDVARRAVARRRSP